MPNRRPPPRLSLFFQPGHSYSNPPSYQILREIPSNTSFQYIYSFFTDKNQKILLKILKSLSNVWGFSNPPPPPFIPTHLLIRFLGFFQAPVTILTPLLLLLDIKEYLGLRNILYKRFILHNETFDDKDIDDEDIEEDINDELDPVPIKKKQIIKCFMCINQKIYKDYTSEMGKSQCFSMQLTRGLSIHYGRAFQLSKTMQIVDSCHRHAVRDNMYAIKTPLDNKR